MVLEDPEEAVEPDVDRRRLQHRGVPGLHHDPAGVDLGQDVAVAEQHARRLPVPPSVELVEARLRAVSTTSTDGSDTMPHVTLPSSTGTSPSATPSPRASATPTPPAPTACAAGPTGSPRCWRTRTDDFGYANLAIRGRTLRPILAEQLEPALALRARPGHHLRRRQRPAPAALRRRRPRRGVRRRDRHARPRPAPGSASSPPSTPAAAGPSRRLRGRFAVYNEQVREIAERHGAVVLDSWRMRPERPDLMWSEDRLHLGPLGHRAIADRGARHPRRPARPRPRRPDRLARRHPVPGRAPGRPRVGACATLPRGSSAASPAARPATAYSRSGPRSSRSDGSHGLGYDPSRRFAGMRM